MEPLVFKGKSYPIQQEISFADFIAVQEIREEIEKANEIEDNKTKNRELERLGLKNVKLVAQVLHDCLGFETKDLKKFTPRDAAQLFNELMAKSAEIAPN